MLEMTLEDLNSFTAVGHCIGNAGQPDLVSAMQRKYGNRNAIRRGREGKGGGEEKYSRCFQVYFFLLKWSTLR